MGNYLYNSLFTSNNNDMNHQNNNLINITNNLSSRENILYQVHGTILKSPYKYLDNTKVQLIFYDNDLIIRGSREDIVIIYNCISKWYRTTQSWGFITNGRTVAKEGSYYILVNNPEKICKVMKNITNDLVEYYKNL